MTQPQFSSKVFYFKAPDPIDHVQVAIEKIKKRKLVLKYTDEAEDTTCWVFGEYLLIRYMNGAYELILYKQKDVVARQTPYNPLFESLIARVRAKKALESWM